MGRTAAKRKRTTKETQQEHGSPSTPARRKLNARDFRGGGMERYEKIFSYRSVIVERKVVLEHLRIATFRFQIIHRGWAPILTVADDVFEEAVREFYSNFEVTNSAEFKASVLLRGKVVEFSAASIAKFVGIARDPNPEFTFSTAEKVLPDLDMVATDICGETRNWPPKGKKMKQSYLTDDNRMVNLIVCACINPGGHTNEIRPEVGRLIYAFNNHMRIDLPSYIFEVVAAAAKSNKKNEGLPFSSLITRVARAAIVTLKLQDVIKYVGGPIRKTTYNKSLVQTENARKRHLADHVQTQDDENEPDRISIPATLPAFPPGEATLDALYATLTDVIQGMRAITGLHQKLSRIDKHIMDMKQHILGKFDADKLDDNAQLDQDCNRCW